LAAEIEKNETTYLACFRTPYYFTIKVQRTDLSSGATALEKLGIGSWKHSRNWRYSGFYSQIITYAEVLQMIASLVLGLFIALDRKRSKTGTILILCLAAMVFTLLLTFTRASQAAFLASAAAMFLIFGNLRMILISTAVIVPLAFGGLVIMERTRNVGFFDQKETSVNYRQTIYREGFDLWTSGTRNFLLGVGMDSTKRFAKEWHLFDNGRLQMGHFHSTPLQLLVERGLPALVLWLWILCLYGGMLLKGLRFKFQNSKSEDQKPKTEDRIENPKPTDWQRRGIILGCFGGLIGFFVSSLVNYSLGDGEVAMVFYILMGIGVRAVNHE
jgi:O-antigen ligase